MELTFVDGYIFMHMYKVPMFVNCSIGNDWSFDDEVATKYGCVVRAFDPRLVDACCVVDAVCNRLFQTCRVRPNRSKNTEVQIFK